MYATMDKDNVTSFDNRELFEDLLTDLIRNGARQWLEENNKIRPHGSLGGLSPLQFVRNFRSDQSIINKMKLPETLTLEVD